MCCKMEKKEVNDIIYIGITMWKEMTVNVQIKAFSHHGYLESAFLLSLIG